MSGYSLHNISNQPRKNNAKIKKVLFSLAESPKMVSISQSLDDIGVMREGQLYSIECEIRNVAPTSRLSVIWYIEYVSVYEERFKGSSHLPATVSSFLNMTANRSHDRSDIWCEAKLDFRPEGESPILRPSVLHRLAVLCEF